MLHPCLPFVFSKKGVKNVSIYWGSFIIQIIAFAILFVLLKKYAFGPLLGVMQKRQEQIENQLKNAEKNRDEAEKLLKDQNDALQKVRIEAHEIIENARNSSSKQANDIIEASKAEAEDIKKQLEEAGAKVELK